MLLSLVAIKLELEVEMRYYGGICGMQQGRQRGRQLSCSKVEQNLSPAQSSNWTQMDLCSGLMRNPPTHWLLSRTRSRKDQLLPKLLFCEYEDNQHVGKFCCDVVEETTRLPAKFAFTENEKRGKIPTLCMTIRRTSLVTSRYT